MTHAELWRHVHDALDERRDPLADEGVLAELERRPEALGEIEALARGLDLLQDAGPVHVPRARHRRLAAAVAICAASLLIALALWTRRSEPSVTPSSASVEQSGRSRVLSYRVSVARTDEHGQTTTTSASDPAGTVREVRVQFRPPSQPPFASLPLTTIVVRNLTRNQP